MEVQTEIIIAVMTALVGGGSLIGIQRWRHNNGSGIDGVERRRGQNELISAVKEQTKVTIEEGSKTRTAIYKSSEQTQTGITNLAKEQAELTGYLRAKL